MDSRKSGHKLYRDFATTIGLMVAITLLMLARDYAGAESRVQPWHQWGSNEAIHIGPNADPRPDTAQTKDSEEVAYIETIFPIISQWDSEKIEPLMVEITREQISDSELDEVVQTLDHSLGELKGYSRPERVEEFDSPASLELRKMSTYQFEAEYERGEADVTLQLVKSHEGWGLLAMNILVRDATG